LSKKILFERIKNSVITAYICRNTSFDGEDSIEYNVVQKSTARVGEDGIIEIN
jgi:hypothetical protein